MTGPLSGPVAFLDGLDVADVDAHTFTHEQVRALVAEVRLRREYRCAECSHNVERAERAERERDEALGKRARDFNLASETIRAGLGCEERLTRERDEARADRDEAEGKRDVAQGERDEARAAAQVCEHHRAAGVVPEQVCVPCLQAQLQRLEVERGGRTS